MSDQGADWTEARPGLWLSRHGKYSITRTEHPEGWGGPPAYYTLREHDTAGRPGAVGRFAGDHLSFGGASYAAHMNDRYNHSSRVPWPPADLQPGHVPVAMERFSWPLPRESAQGALTFTCENGLLVARVTALEADGPVTCAEISVIGGAEEYGETRETGHA